ncbi:terpene synthase family protein [Aspergillus glaucus CBS 516.65]|uniref:Uncharacterized protein n=1 Tax=Aspergillus glaucus CBS 516.65 TaxID=1160497 RepID=A0A1L9V808_ASPGL|nr:hypothetical protein ASPGLDRAFT_39348 [Aspergillus glaucus CBS 516.65]OJJ80056.1 hypothetical protein ASPGLDRAFT_39348 [Aspergillus glaucus CBS 516.65]
MVSSSSVTASLNSCEPSEIVPGTKSRPIQDSMEKHAVYIPDLFSSIMSVKPFVNPNYDDVKVKADLWITKIMHADEKWAAKNSKAYYASWHQLGHHIVFLFDDQFDEGHLCSDSVAGQEEINKILAVMEDTEPPVQAEEDPMRYRELLQVYLKQRLKNTHREYFDGLLNQVQIKHEQCGLARDLQESMEVRRKTIGAFPVIALTKYALGIDLSQEIVEGEQVRETRLLIL